MLLDMLSPAIAAGARLAARGIVFDGPSLRFRGIRLNASKPEKGRVPGRHAIYMTATQDVSGDFYSSAVVASPSVRLESAVEGVGSPFLALSCMVSGWDWAGRTYFLWKGRYRSVLSVEEFPEVRANFFREFLDYGDLDAMLVCTVSEVQRPDRVLARALAALRARRDLAPETVRRASRVDEMVRYAEYLLSASAEGERIYSCTASIVVSAPDPVGLRENIEALERRVVSLGGRLRLLNTYEVPARAMKHMVPGRENGLYITHSSLDAIAVPEPARPTSGTFLGYREDRRKFLFDPFRHNSFNVCVVGETGSGKSHFVKRLLQGLLADTAISAFLIVDPLDEYSPLFPGAAKIDLRRSAFDPFSARQGSFIFVTGTQRDRDSAFRLALMLRFIPEWMKQPGRKVLVFEEMSNLLWNRELAAFAGSIVRHSRHYLTSVVSVTQNMDDLRAGDGDWNILLNSAHIFIFRTPDLGGATSLLPLREMRPQGSGVARSRARHSASTYQGAKGTSSRCTRYFSPSLQCQRAQA